jgi:hypothetical protein
VEAGLSSRYSRGCVSVGGEVRAPMSDVRQMSWLNPLSVPLPPKKFVTKYSARGKPCRAISQELNKRIHQLRKLGLKQWEIARELGVSRPTVGKHLQGARKL